MKIIPIPLSFGLTDTIYETKMGFKTADVNSAVLQFTSDSDPVGCVATLSMKNETDNSNRFSLVLEQMDVTTNPFSYTLGDEIGSSGVWIGEITLKKDLVTVCSQEFRFSVGESLQTSIMDVLIQAKSVDEMMVAIQEDVTEHLGKSTTSVAQITAYVNGVVAKLLATDNTRTLQERDRVLAELARETDYQSWVEAVQTLIDTAVIDARVQAIIDEYQSTYAQSLFSVTQQLAHTGSRIDNIIATPTDVSEQEIIDSRYDAVSNILYSSIGERLNKDKSDYKNENLLIKSKVSNGDFSKGLTGWVNRDLKFTAPNILENNKPGVPSYLSQTGLFTLNHRVYLRIKAERVSGDGVLKVSASSAVPYLTINTSGVVTLSGIFDSIENLYIYVSHGTSGTSFKIHSIIGIELSDYFEQGSEPTKESLDSVFNDKKVHHDTITNKDLLMNYLLNSASTGNVNFEIGSKNRFDKSKTTVGTILDNGSIYSSEGWLTSDFISVEKSKSIAINKCRFVAEYASNKNFIAGTYKNLNPEAQSVFTTNASTAYVRVTTRTSNVDGLQVEYGTAPTSYEKFYLTMYQNGEKVIDLKDSESTYVSEELLKLPGMYDMQVNRDKYQIYKARGQKDIKAVHGNIAVVASGTAYGTVIDISTTGINGNYDKSVVFNNTNFPNLPTGSAISKIMIIPFTRSMTTGQPGNDYRICVITNNGLCYHNYPARATNNDGTVLAGDITRFDESAIWDLPERKYPSLNKTASGTERYMPGLPTERYNYYPAVNNDNGYGNGGWGNYIIKDGVYYPRFYQPGRISSVNSLSSMGGYEPTDKLTLIGTYRTNVADAVRICLFATDDGGRSWHVKYEFSKNTNLNSTAIDTSIISENYIANSFKIVGKHNVMPTAAIKEPTEKFILSNDVIVSSISKGAKTLVTTSSPHGLSTGNVIAFKTNTGSSAGWDWLLNNELTTTSGGNGVLFGVKVTSANSFELYEYVSSAFNNISCRHIHYINRIKSGFLFGTGEEYPEGFLFHAYMPEADTWHVRRAHEHLEITRLTSTPEAPQRLLGAVMYEDVDNTIICAMDTALAPLREIELPDGRLETINVNSTGIYKGRLVDVDDLTLFDISFEAKEPAYFFKEKGDALIFVGQRGEFAISFDKGDNWTTEKLTNVAQHFRGETNKFIVINEFVIVLK